MSPTLKQEEYECSTSCPPITSFSMCKANHFIVSSPYPDHLLELATLDEPSKELAIVLQELTPNEGYLDLPYDQAFNWSTILPKLSPNFPATEFYIVAFQSHLALSSVNSGIVDELHAQDKLSHFEASESGGLLKYWFGVPASDRRNLATCVWTNRDWALKASTLPQHVKARGIVWRGVYESWAVEKYTLSVGGGNKWAIDKFQ
jgi:hypothetical protein